MLSSRKDPENCTRIFLDTNILVYAHDSGSPPKKARSQDILFELLRARAGVLSAQVLSEFFVTVTQKVEKKMAPAQARQEILLLGAKVEFGENDQGTVHQRILGDTYGIEGRSLHCETLKRGHHRYLNLLKFDSYDPGVNPDIAIEEILDECPGLFFTFNLFTVRDMLNGTPDSVRALCEDDLRRGAPGVMTEITVRTPEANIRAFLESMRRHAATRQRAEPDPVYPKD